MQPKLSVIIPVYNVEKYIRQCLDSVYSQTFRDFEVIIIDDGSPDNCGKICDEYAEKYKNEISTKVVHKENGGLCSVRNDGILIASGEYFTTVDSDDWIEADYFEKMFLAMGDKRPDVFCAGACFKNYSEEQIITHCFIDNKFYSSREEKDYMMIRALMGEKSTNDDVDLSPTLATWDKLYRIDFIKNNNLKFDSAAAPPEDVLFNLIAFDKSSLIGTSTVCGYHYRQVENSMSRGYRPSRKNTYNYFLETANNYLLQNNSNYKIISALNAYAIHLIVSLLNGYFCNINNQLSYKEKAKEFTSYKKTPCYAKAIKDKRNSYMSTGAKIWQFIFRLPGFAPVKIVYSIRNKR